MLPIEALEQAEFELNMEVSASGMQLVAAKDIHKRGEMSDSMLAQAFAEHKTMQKAHGIVKEQLDNVRMWRFSTMALTPSTKWYAWDVVNILSEEWEAAQTDLETATIRSIAEQFGVWAELSDALELEV